MNTIYKYPLKGIHGEQEVYLPENCQILDVRIQEDLPVLWVQVNPKSHLVKRFVELYFTGDEVKIQNRRYIATFQHEESGLVIHAYEVKA